MTLPPGSPAPCDAVAVWAQDPADRSRAQQIAEALGLPLRDSVPSEHSIQLVLSPVRLELRSSAADTIGPVWVDLLGPRLAWRRRTGGARSDDLARAVGLGRPRPLVLDATAGLGRDAWFLAGLGCQVLAYERSPVVWALLEDGLRRVRDEADADQDQLDRFTLRLGDARLALPTLRGDARPDVVLIDPMYPPSRRSALPRKDMRLLAQLLGQDDDAHELLTLARVAARKRVVVKRHLRDAPLGGIEPTHSRSGRSTRFDVYVRDRSTDD